MPYRRSDPVPEPAETEAHVPLTKRDPVTDPAEAEAHGIKAHGADRGR
jgi:hypothetical protein